MSPAWLMLIECGSVFLRTKPVKGLRHHLPRRLKQGNGRHPVDKTKPPVFNVVQYQM